jgi:hypothetical protein
MVHFNEGTAVILNHLDIIIMKLKSLSFTFAEILDFF